MCDLAVCVCVVQTVVHPKIQVFTQVFKLNCDKKTRGLQEIAAERRLSQ